MQTNKILLVSLLVTGISVNVFSFYELGDAYDLVESNDMKTVKKPSDICEGSVLSLGGVFGETIYCVPSEVPILGRVVLDKNTGICLLVNSKNNENMNTKDIKFAPAEMLLAFQGPFTHGSESGYNWNLYTDSRLNNIKVGELVDCTGMDAKEPSVDLVERILDCEKVDSLSIKTELKSTNMTLNNLKEGGVQVNITREGETISDKFDNYIAHGLRGESKALLEQSKILAVWYLKEFSIGKDSEGKEIYNYIMVGLAEKKDTKKGFLWVMNTAEVAHKLDSEFIKTSESKN